ncbi:MAG TPA: SDR family oxidoreductase [Parafilimonas sp.]|nr:SDR family oxidoreductase [Parafilimonas sp.]
MFRLDRKVAIVTGGASGIGKAIANLFVQQGAVVYVLDLDDGGTSLDEGVVDGRAHFLKCNVSNQAEVIDAVAEIYGKYKRIDILINNAGIAHIGTAETTSEEDFDRLMSVNVKGVYNCLHAAIPYMQEQGGSIVNMASVAALVGLPDRFAYSTTKGAVISMTLSVAKDFLEYKIRCNSISPGRVHTPFVDGYLAKNYPGKEAEMFEKLSKTQPIGRMGKPEEIAQLALYLCSDEASFITGCDYPIDGGFVKLNT